MDAKLDPSFRGKTTSQHIEDGIVVVFEYAIPDEWADKTTVYVVHPSEDETTLSNEENGSPDTFDFRPFSWASIHVNLIKIGPTELRVQIPGEHKRPHIDLIPSQE